MEVKAAKSIFGRLGKAGCDSATEAPINKVCSYWLAGKCTRKPCRFLHTEMLPSQLPTAAHLKVTRATKRAQLAVSEPPFKRVPRTHKRENTWRRSPDSVLENTSISKSEGVKSESGFNRQSSPLPSKEVGPKIKRTILRRCPDSVLENVPTLITVGVKSESGCVRQSLIYPSNDLEPKSKSITWQRNPDNILENTPIFKSEGVGSGSGFNGQISLSPSKEVEPESKYTTWLEGPDTVLENASISKYEGVKSNINCIKESSVSPNIKEAIRCKSSENVQTTFRTKVCEDWLNGTCVCGDKCQNCHSWFCGDGFSMLAKLEGHSKAVTGITFPSGSDKLYSSGSDAAVRVWDCVTGKCDLIACSDGVGCLISEGQCLYLGLENIVEVWNPQTKARFSLTGPVGQVYTMTANEEMLYAGTQDGTVLAWKFSNSFSSVELVASMKGHIREVVSLISGACHRLYSGSIDNTIRVWDTNTFQCIQMLEGHAAAVTSLLCWNSYLLSCSLDRTIKAWAESESGDIVVIHTFEDNHGFLSLHGIHDVEEKPILLCSCTDGSVRLYDLPTYIERGRLFSKGDVRSIASGRGGVFFIGDALGQITVWKLDGDFPEPVREPISSV